MTKGASEWVSFDVTETVREWLTNRGECNVMLNILSPLCDIALYYLYFMLDTSRPVRLSALHFRNENYDVKSCACELAKTGTTFRTENYKG